MVETSEGGGVGEGNLVSGHIHVKPFVTTCHINPCLFGLKSTYLHLNFLDVLSTYSVLKFSKGLSKLRH